MAAKYITKVVDVFNKNENGKKVKAGTKEVTYRIDADFVPTAMADICQEFIENYCKAKNEMEWLLEQVNETITDKNGKIRDKGFVAIRSEFCDKFFKDLRASEKAETWKEKLNRLYKK